MKALLPIVLLVAGVALFLYGLALPRYHNQEEYERRYRTLEGPTRSEDFYELRRQSVTPSLRFQDYGLTIISIAALVLVAVRWRPFVAFLPKKKVTVALLGALAASTAISAQVGSLFLDYERDEFPHWADSLGIPLAGARAIFLALLVWAWVHSLLVKKNETQAWRLTLRHANWWLAFLITATVFVLVVSVVAGAFWQVVPAALWIAFYLSIWISRSKAEPYQAEQSK